MMALSKDIGSCLLLLFVVQLHRRMVIMVNPREGVGFSVFRTRPIRHIESKTWENQCPSCLLLSQSFGCRYSKFLWSVKTSNCPSNQSLHSSSTSLMPSNIFPHCNSFCRVTASGGKKATGNILGHREHWDSITPSPVSEISTSTIKGFFMDQDDAKWERTWKLPKQHLGSTAVA